MAPPNKKILLQYLWADEVVMRDDFLAKVYRGITDFANQFYKRFGFELDVIPGPDVKVVAKASKFALQKNDGARPDMASLPKIAVEYQEKVAAFQPKIDALTKENLELDAKLEALHPWDHEERAEINSKRADNFQALSKIYVTQREIVIEQQGAVALANGDTQLRIMMMAKFMNDGVGDGRRLNVAFCRFVPLPKTKYKGDTLAETRPQRAVTMFGPTVLWPFQYIVVDIGKGAPVTVAHEIVHAAGHVHPPAQMLAKDLKKTQKLFSPPTSFSDAIQKVLTITDPTKFLDQFVEVPGGYFDGPKTDIMYYLSQGMKASQLTLSEADKKLLEGASFVAG